jgi:hypothetical protein
MIPTSTDEDENRIPHSNNPYSGRQHVGSWSTKQLLKALDDRGIRYPPTASRSDLEDLYRKTYDEPHFDVNIDKTAVDAQSAPKWDERLTTNGDTERSKEVLEEHLQRRARRRRLYQQDEPSWSKTVVRQIPKVAGTVVPKVAGTLWDRAARKARRLRRNAVDFFATDEETGVRDVRYQYLHKQQQQPDSPPSVIVDVPARDVEVIVVNKTNHGDGYTPFPFPSGGTKNGVGASSHPGQSRTTTIVARSKGARTAPRRPPSSYQSRQQRRRPTEDRDAQTSRRGNVPRRPPLYDDRKAETSSPYYLLPSSDTGDDFPRHSYQRRSRRRVPLDTQQRPPPRKRVYSPYTTSGFEDPAAAAAAAAADDDRDVVDHVADFLADTADKFMWGKFDDKVPRQKKSDFTPNPRPRPRKQQPRHWKDRLEERLDSMMGLHEDGDFYTKWAAREEQEKREEGGNDVFSVAQGRQPKKRQKRIYDKPFWEEEGNLISLLFGRNKSGGNLFFENRLGFESGSVLVLIRAALKSFMLVGSYLCRWASTQGALPQPVVVMGVTAAGLCARPRRRLLAIGIALLLLRTVGEVLHGYAYGPESWEDDGNDDNFDYDDGEGSLREDSEM